jgi:H2-forming N5,N10-methylenetetrahydromethanopterin dehydrogenase-like enzyme
VAETSNLIDQTDEAIMSVEEARKLLGKKFVYMTDVEVTKLIDDVDVLATIALRVAMEEFKNKGSKFHAINLPPELSDGINASYPIV